MKKSWFQDFYCEACEAVTAVEAHLHDTATHLPHRGYTFGSDADFCRECESPGVIAEGELYSMYSKDVK